MAFKGMDARFTQKVNDLYNRGSARDSGPSGRSDQPYVVIPPNDPNRNETRHDNRSVPFGSIKRDVIRIGKYSKSSEGLLFLARQQTLQTGNTFSETRLINPLFVIGNVQPFKRVRRVLSTTASAPPSGDQRFLSPGSRGQVGGAGRLQKSTSKAVIAAVTGGGGKSGLLSFLDPGKLISGIAGAFGVGTGAGSLGINQRPELDVAGNYFSVQLWKGFQKYEQQRGFLDRASAQLRQGNIGGAVNTFGAGIGNAVNEFIFGRTGNTVGLSAPNGRDNPLNTSVNGSRYFILDRTTADRYLQNSVLNGPDGYALPNTGYLNRQPYILGGASLMDATPLSAVSNPTQQTATQQARTGTSGGFWNNLVKGFQGAFNQSFTSAVTQTVTSVTNTVNLQPSRGAPAKDHMRFQALALENRYQTDARMAFIKTQVENQRKAGLAYWKTTRRLAEGPTKRAWVGGIKAGDELNPIPEAKVRFAGGMYLKDAMGSIGVVPDPPAAKSSSYKGGTDFIDVFFFDFVNKKTVPFRAFISGINETVAPEVSDTRYIGRIERNIVYVGVCREITFQLRVQAFSKSDLARIWDKINYVTGLCYPATYVEGFMVPPFVKLTLGNIYRDQPGYLKAVAHTIEDDQSWEVTEGSQAPMGILMNITFSCVEKSILDTTSTFYPVGR
jgi:hypothetical protein